ncbi:intersectin-1 isoform X2 [Teleopsis dalmanni]|uniref:intersectin-1 isoform X2 n=1 Tax=Teleopsis dalmanni TaxID=139649 RepID=UPI0018CEC556|nr:intersectin-1 isoform X2 [Teleopsis dalmanni]
MSISPEVWVVTPHEKAKFQEHFKALQPQNGFVTGAQAKGFFLQSQLEPLVLGKIWSLADTDSDGKMNINEFSIACKLISLKLRGVELPTQLPHKLLTSVAQLEMTPSITPTGSMSPLDPVKTAGGMKPIIPGVPNMPVAMTNISNIPGSLPGTVPTMVPTVPNIGTSPIAIVPTMPLQQMPIAGANIVPTAAPQAVQASAATIPGVMPNILPTVGTIPTAVIPSTVPMAGAVPPTKIISPPSGDVKVPATPTPPHSNPPSRNMSISERAPSIESPQGEWAVKAAAKRKYTQVFNANDRNRTGFLTGAQARNVLIQSKLPQVTLAQIWTLSDLDGDGRLSCDEFILAMFLCDKAMSGEKIPSTLPADWIPPTYRKSKSRQGSVSGPGSRTGSTPSSRHASVSSQGTVDADPSAGLPQTTFEDKRKENFDKGQAELDRRRKLLQDQQRKEKEERERKEREEAEKREKARLEAERKQQEELERQLQKQRELEMEKEEQRKRELEAKEAARKELEKQRQLEWEQARIAEMNSQKQREQERVLKHKAHNTQLNVELSTLNEKIKELSQKICDTRASVTNVKSIIDGMRSQRDTSMSEMAQFKARIKEQNAKLLQLTQERAKWDAKVKAAGVPGDVAQQEQMNAAFANKQLIIKQLKDKVENIQKDIEAKKEDINSNDVQVAEVKGELSALINKCEELYADYDKQRTQVLELKYNKRNDNVTTATGWETSATWGADSYNTVVENAVPAVEGYTKYRAVYEFSARNEDEITFAPGDIILVPINQTTDPGWLSGEINGHTGLFPETYVEKIEDDYVTAAVVNPIAATTDTQVIPGYAAQDTFNDNSQINGDVEYYIAAYPYESAELGDLTFGAGEMVMVTKKEGDWWTGTVGNRTGIFPWNYVQKADVGTTGTAAVTDTPIDSTAPYQEQTDNNVNGNASTYETVKTAPLQEQQLNKDNTCTTQKEPIAPLTTSNSTTNVEETHTNEELDTEVSQINTQSKSQNEPAESYSRPMSRTSSMTPGMRAKRSEIAQVIAPYEATSAEQLSLTRGQLIMIRKKTDSGWWEGELQAKGRRRQIGWFPASYVKVLQGGRNSGRNTPVSGSRIEMTEQILDKVIALYQYKAQNDDELSFEKDDIISVLGRDEPEWWRGELNGISGLFPSNYVGPFVTSGNV